MGSLIVINLFSFAFFETKLSTKNHLRTEGCYWQDNDNYTNLAKWYCGKPSSIEEPLSLRDDNSYNYLKFRASSTFLRDVNGFAFAYGNGDFFLQNLKEEKPIKINNPKENKITSIKRIENQGLFVTGNQNGDIFVWSSKDLIILNKIPLHKGAILSLAYEPSMDLLAVGGEDGKITILEIDSLKVVKILYGHYSSITSLEFSPNQKKLFSGSYDTYAYAWDINTWKKKFLLKGHEEIYDIKVGKEGNDIYISTRSGFIFSCLFKNWQCKKVHWKGYSRNKFLRPKIRVPIPYDKKNIYPHIILGDKLGHLYLYNNNFDHEIGKHYFHKSAISTLSLDSSGKYLFTASIDGSFKIFSLTSLKTILDYKVIKGVDSLTKGLLGISHTYRQAGYPFLESIFMKMLDMYSACSVRIVQSWFMVFFFLIFYVQIKKYFNSITSLLFMSQLCFKDNPFYYFARADITELFLTIFLTCIITIYFKYLKSPSLNSNYLYFFLASTFLSMQINLLTGVYLIILFIISLALSLLVRKENFVYGHKSFYKALILLFSILPLVFFTKSLYPESSKFKSENLLAQKATLLPPNQNDAEILKFKKFNKISNKFERLGNRIHYNGNNHFMPIFREVDRLTLVDPETKEYVHYTKKEASSIILRLTKNNLSLIFFSGLKNVLKNYSIFFKASSLKGIVKFLWILVVLLGVYYAFKSQNKFIVASLLLTSFGYFCFFCFMHNVHDRYWFFQSNFVVLSFAIGFNKIWNYSRILIIKSHFYKI
ncbi:hypothetical protein OAK75_00095 [Bacteriovoracales bacterium]|nr:hypothetical protein [Bacteriovoracales bacterium]